MATAVAWFLWFLLPPGPPGVYAVRLHGVWAYRLAEAVPPPIELVYVKRFPLDRPPELTLVLEGQGPEGRPGRADGHLEWIRIRSPLALDRVVRGRVSSWRSASEPLLVERIVVTDRAGRSYELASQRLVLWPVPDDRPLLWDRRLNVAFGLGPAHPYRGQTGSSRPPPHVVGEGHVHLSLAEGDGGRAGFHLILMNQSTAPLTVSRIFGADPAQGDWSFALGASLAPAEQSGIDLPWTTEELRGHRVAFGAVLEVTAAGVTYQMLSPARYWADVPGPRGRVFVRMAPIGR